MTDHPRSTGTQRDEVSRAIELLASGIPLTLLLDLATPVHSREIYDTERGQADWLIANVA